MADPFQGLRPAGSQVEPPAEIYIKRSRNGREVRKLYIYYPKRKRVATFRINGSRRNDQGITFLSNGQRLGAGDLLSTALRLELQKQGVPPPSRLQAVGKSLLTFLAVTREAVRSLLE